MLNLKPEDRPAVLDVKDVIKRMPRFTDTEIRILNELRNADGKPVTVRQLASLVGGSSSSIPIHVYHLRMKLGEQRHNPTTIVSTYVEFGTPEHPYRVPAFKFMEQD